MNRIKQLFQEKNNNILNVYFTAGFPQINDTALILKALQDGGADLVETYFSSMTTPAVNTSIQKLTNNPTSLNFTTADLSSIGSGKTVALIINFYKNNVQVINGKNYNFRTVYEVVKTNIKFK